MSKAADIAQSILNVATDPCLYQVAGQLNELHELHAGDTGPGGPVQAKLGIGLCHAVKPLDAIIWARKNPWIFLALAGTVVGGIFVTGYKYGKRKQA
jgi:hypothetical protein